MSWGWLSIILIGLLPLTGCSSMFRSSIDQGKDFIFPRVGMTPFIANATSHTVTVRQPVFFLYFEPKIEPETKSIARLGCPDDKPHPYFIPSTDRSPWSISFALFTNIRHALSGSRTLEEAVFRIISQTAYWDFVFVCRKHLTSESESGKISLGGEKYPLPKKHRDRP